MHLHSYELMYGPFLAGPRASLYTFEKEAAQAFKTLKLTAEKENLWSGMCEGRVPCLSAPLLDKPVNVLEIGRVLYVCQLEHLEHLHQLNLSSLSSTLEG